VLSTDEAFAVLDRIRALGTPVVVLSGGEPLMRDDLCAIARYGTGLGLRMVMGTSGYFLDRPTAARLREAGIRAAAISLDSADPAVHDSFRGVSGAWERAVCAIKNCNEAGIGVQINMTAVRPAAGDIESVVALGKSLGVQDYQVFFPIPTGRAGGTGPEHACEYEDVIRQVLLRYRDGDVNLRPTCAPQFRRIATDLGIEKPGWGRGCIAGISYCRIYANGDVTPCPYLPVSAGNVRDVPFDRIWNESPVFAALRDPARLTGKCGRCTYKTVCGGCRARAYRGREAFSSRWCDGLEQPAAIAGELCAEDPWCPYEPGDRRMNDHTTTDSLDLLILDALQQDIPLVARPWEAIAARLGIPEPLFIGRLRHLYAEGIIRGISPIIESRALGLAAGTLVALPVPEDRIREVADIVSRYPEVSHNFRRDHQYSLWFTLSGENEAAVEKVLSEILERTGFSRDKVLDLATVKKIKIDVRFPLVPCTKEVS